MTPTDGQLIATCPGGLERVLAAEIAGRGWRVLASGSGMVRFGASGPAVAEANITLRTASRILVPICSGPVASYDQLYRLAASADWSALAPPERSIGVTTISTDRRLADRRFATLRVKDAVVDVQKQQTGRRSTVRRQAPDVGIVAHIADGVAELSLDSTGLPLHVRGYRAEAGAAPLRETVAAGMVLLSGWDGTVPLMDPFCGSGTILIEAACIATGTLPGIHRSDFSFLRWPGADRAVFEQSRASLLTEAERTTAARSGSPIRGADRDPAIVRTARSNVIKAGVGNLVSVDRSDFFDARPSAPPGILLTNPPYGERLGLDDAADFYRTVGNTLKARYHGWTAWILSANMAAMKHIGLRTSAKLPLWNGGLESRLYKIEIY